MKMSTKDVDRARRDPDIDSAARTILAACGVGSVTALAMHHPAAYKDLCELIELFNNDLPLDGTLEDDQ